MNMIAGSIASKLLELKMGTDKSMYNDKTQEELIAIIESQDKDLRYMTKEYRELREENKLRKFIKPSDFGATPDPEMTLREKYELIDFKSFIEREHPLEYRRAVYQAINAAYIMVTRGEYDKDQVTSNQNTTAETK